MNELEKEIKKLSRLTQYKKADKSSLTEIAQKNVWVRQINIAQRFTSPEAKKMSCEIFENYLNTYSFSSFADIETVADLVFEEVTKLKIQQQISVIAADDTNKFLPDRLIDSLHKVEETIWSLKEKAGIVGKKEQDDLSALEELKKKFKTYIAFNKNEFTCVVEGSKILMGNLTTKNVEDVQIGDEIIGLKKKNYSWEIKKQKVLNKQCNGVKEVIKIKAGNNSLELTPDHRILAEAGFQDKGTDIRYFEASKCWGRNVKVFNCVDNLSDYYAGMLIGFIESDGWVHQSKTCNSHGYHIAQKVEYKAVEFLLNYFNLKYTKTNRIRINTGSLPNLKGKQFQCFEYHLSTSNNDFIEKIYAGQLNNNDIDFGYLAGFLLGDGTRDINNSWRIYQSTKVNQYKIDIIIKILEKHKLSYTINKAPDNMITINVGSCRIPMINPESKKIKTWTKHFIECQPFYSLNKFKLRFVDIEKKKKVYDLTTETENFVANGFVVHNCWLPVVCKKCGEKDIQPILLRRRVKDFKALKHPFFSGRFLFNVAIMDDVENEVITKEQAAKYLQTSVKYIEWAIENRYKIVEVDNVSKEDINEFIDDKPYLGNTKKSIENLK